MRSSGPSKRRHRENDLLSGKKCDACFTDICISCKQANSRFDVAADTTAFGCRDWDFACVITGVWPRDQDGSRCPANVWVVAVI
ncbi:hypothetical protein GQ44DRAFT_703995 [Phaeosphaeriaceae sp. PMI808]|nr:hypothetical protein GQ44DRAFT_703995 [Phaeosphaeriaceae sp. PMI808]